MIASAERLERHRTAHCGAIVAHLAYDPTYAGPGHQPGGTAQNQLDERNDKESDGNVTGLASCAVDDDWSAECLPPSSNPTKKKRDPTARPRNAIRRPGHSLPPSIARRLDQIMTMPLVGGWGGITFKRGAILRRNRWSLSWPNIMAAGRQRAIHEEHQARE
jgi:hypothetical protein